MGNKKSAMTEKPPLRPLREGAVWCEVPAEIRGKCHHSRAAWDDRDGTLPLQGTQATVCISVDCKQGGTVELTF